MQRGCLEKMKRKYNEYTDAILQYLKQFHELKAYYANLCEEIDAKEELLRTVSAPITRYSLVPRGGGFEGSKVEAEMEKRAKIEDELQGLKIDSAALKMNLMKIERALEALDEESRKIVTMRWLEERKWEYIALCLHCSSKNCRYKNKAALEKMALVYFGPVSMQDQAAGTC